MAFTPQQQQAIDHDGHLLIVAGPGSGKTTTSVAKAQRILQDPGRSLIMVTFTKEGAVEMQRRLDAACTKSGIPAYGENRLIVATFHSIAIRHLQRHLGKQKVLSPVQQNLLFQDALSVIPPDPDLIKGVREQFESYMYAIDRSTVALMPESSKVIKRYRERLEGTGQTDLYTIMRDCALRVNDGSIPPMPYTDMLVDEGQDTDELQKTWIFSHARAGCNVTIVGDDDQSIYEWRQALGYGGMKSFLDTFHAKRIELGDNFRCRSEILTHAVTLVEHNKQRLGKKLVARRGRGGGICAFRIPGSDAQAEELAGLISATPEQHSNTVVLARKNRSLDALEMELRSHGIEYRRMGKSIWENPHIAGYLTFLQTLLDGTPVGILAALRLQAISDNLMSELLQVMDGSAAAFLDGDIPDLETATAQDRKILEQMSKDCKYWRDQLRANALTGGSVREVIMETGDVYSSWMERRNMAELVQLCARILSDMSGTLSARLRLVSQKSRVTNNVPVVLMTMHGSKGLEFETVHIIDASADESDASLLHQEPERRLMYVALTRAKNRCVVWFSGKPHPTVQEAQIPLKHRIDEVRQIIEQAH